LDAAANLKIDDSAWHRYLNALLPAAGTRPSIHFERNLGCFAIVLQNQLEVINLREAERNTEKVTVSSTPVSGRTRSQLEGIQPVPFAVQPSAESAKIPRGHSANSEREGRPREAGKVPERKAASDVSEAKSHATVFSAIHFDLSKEQRDAIEDEQVVYTAAITLLQSLFVHDSRRNAYWSAQRKGSCLGNAKGPAAFKAITDGHLKVEGETRSAGILEVKARKRPHIDDFRIETQGSSQMALWIYEELASYWASKDDPSACH
jgi:hypothetical protein